MAKKKNQQFENTTEGKKEMNVVKISGKVPAPKHIHVRNNVLVYTVCDNANSPQLRKKLALLKNCMPKDRIDKLVSLIASVNMNVDSMMALVETLYIYAVCNPHYSKKVVMLCEKLSGFLLPVTFKRCKERAEFSSFLTSYCKTMFTTYCCSKRSSKGLLMTVEVPTEFKSVNVSVMPPHSRLKSFEKVNLIKFIVYLIISGFLSETFINDMLKQLKLGLNFSQCFSNCECILYLLQVILGTGQLIFTKQEFFQLIFDPKDKFWCSFWKSPDNVKKWNRLLTNKHVSNYWALFSKIILSYQKSYICKNMLTDFFKAEYWKNLHYRDWVNKVNKKKKLKEYADFELNFSRIGSVLSKEKVRKIGKKLLFKEIKTRNYLYEIYKDPIVIKNSCNLSVVKRELLHTECTLPVTKSMATFGMYLETVMPDLKIIEN